MEVSAMASMMAYPREGHLQQLYQMFLILKSKYNGVMIFDFTEPNMKRGLFIKEDWSAAAYGECIEELPINMPESRGSAMVMKAFISCGRYNNKKIAYWIHYILE